jgi:hypothetical protein
MPVIVMWAPLVDCVLGGEVKLEAVDDFHVWGCIAGGERRQVYVLFKAGYHCSPQPWTGWPGPLT